MPVEEDVKPEKDEERSDNRAEEDLSRGSRDASSPSALAPGAGEPEDAERADARAESSEQPAGAMSPIQLGTVRFVYAGYFAAAVAVAFMVSKVVDLGWQRLQSYKPAIGDPRDEIVMPLSALVGAGTALYFWFRTRARELAEEVAAEMAKVTWPSRAEVTNGTVVVIVTTVISTVFFALMDKFWGFVTNLVYGGT